MSLLDYYKSKGITNFEKGLFGEQRAKIDTDPEGKSFDITLLYRCLRNGHHGLAPTNDNRWKTDDRASVESLITISKNKRNDLAHEPRKYTFLQLLRESMDIKGMLLQILEFCRQIYHPSDDTINEEINRVEANMRKYLYESFEGISNLGLSQATSKYVNEDGAGEVLRKYGENKENEINTVNHLADVSLPLEKVYIEMEQKGEHVSGHEQATSYAEVLENIGQTTDEDIIVINGRAGVGKTCFIKYMIYDWGQKLGEMMHLSDYDHLLKTECRNPSVWSFNDILHRLMPTVSQVFKPGDLKTVVLAQKVLLILDGLDEMNKASAHLFDEVLKLKQSYRLSVLITTRPEKLDYLEEKLKENNYRMKQIDLIGVPKEKREELVRKYHSAIKTNMPDIQKVQGLLSYLHKTELRLTDLWRLPYNLFLITVLWAYNHMKVNEISTSPELYIHILDLYETKLRERLSSSEAGRTLNAAEIRIKTEHFMYIFSKESLVALMNDQITMPFERFENLQNICTHLGVPVEEMVGAFLKPVHSQGISYTYPHKGLQDFLAANYVFLEITGTSKEFEVEETEAIREFIRKNPKSQALSHAMMQTLECKKTDVALRKGKLPKFLQGSIGKYFPSLKASTLIQKILTDAYGSANYDLPKFQNMFLCLLGMYYSRNSVSVEESIKLETLLLLQNTGVRGKDDWLSVLTSVKCDEFIAKFINEHAKLKLKGKIQITDSTMCAYMSLMQAMKLPMKDASKVQVEICTHGELLEAHGLFEVINSHQFRIRTILITQSNMKDYTSMLNDLQTSMKEAEEVGINIDVPSGILTMKELVEAIKGRKLKIVSLPKEKITIDDGNQAKYSKVFEALPTLDEGVFGVEIIVKIKQISSDTHNLMLEIMRNGLCVEILIDEDNEQAYTTMLKDPGTPLKDAENVRININLPSGILAMKDLLRTVGAKNLKIKSLPGEHIMIDDGNLEDFSEVLKYLPTFDDKVFEGRPTVNFDSTDQFRHPTQAIAYQDSLNTVFQRCNIEGKRRGEVRYTGQLTEHMDERPFRKMKVLYVSIGSSPQAFKTLKRIITTAKIEHLYVSLDVSSLPLIQELSPLNGVNMVVNVFLPDIGEEDIEGVGKMLKRLLPTQGERYKSFDHVLFPRMKLTRLDQIERCIHGIRKEIPPEGIFSSLVFPLKSLRDSISKEEKETLSEMTENILGTRRGISWRYPSGSNKGSILDMDTW